MPKIDPQLIGQILLERGFKDFFLYMFKIIENRPFIVEPIHHDLFQMVDDILNMRKIRLCCGICPRSAKTTICKWLIVYAWTINPKCNFIYTSYSQSLLATISNEIAGILEHPIYKAMYPRNLIYQEDINTMPVDSFWEDYLKNIEGKNLYSTKKITTYAGGTCIFQSKGAQLTGHGASVRNAKKFSGGIILDDFDKPDSVNSVVLREKSYRYYDETLLSRLNNPKGFILNVQQRLHIADITGYLTEKYHFDIINKPLLDENGVCQIPSQYTPERIAELKLNNYAFQAQYMQNPIYRGGSVIKREWFGYYNPTLQQTYKRIVISADTAMTVKEKSDYTCLLVGGVTAQNKLHILEMVHAKLEYPELKQAVINLYNKYKEGETKCSAIYIENKASGIQLLQDFKKVGLPVCGIDVTKDKLTRVEEILEYLASGLVLLPESESYGNNPEFLAECEAFTRDFSHQHDDQCFIAGTKIATIFGDKNIDDVKKGDVLITPLGLTKVQYSGCTGEREVITNVNLTGTPTHKIFSKHDDKFDNLSNMTYNNCSLLTLKDLLLWEKMKLLYLMVNDTMPVARTDIIKHTTFMGEQDFIAMFGNIVQGKKFQKVMKYIIKMAIDIIITLTIWNVYHLGNIIIGTLNSIKYGKDPKCKKQVQEVVKNVKFGIALPKGKNGIAKNKKRLVRNLFSKKYVKNAVQFLPLGKAKKSKSIVENAEINFINASYDNKHEKNVKKVYNLKTDKGIYYANNILVSNCDALVHLVNNTIANRKVSLLEVL